MKPPSRIQEHKDRADDLDIRTEARDAVVAGTEAACPGGAERGTDRIEQRHPAAEQEDDVEGGQGDIDQVEHLRRLAHFRYEFPDRGTRALRAEDVERIALVASADGDQSEQEDQNPHTAQPMAEAAPIEDPFRKSVYGGRRSRARQRRQA